MKNGEYLVNHFQFVILYLLLSFPYLQFVIVYFVNFCEF